MKFRGFSVALLASLIATGAVQAVSLGDGSTPAETPPAQYTGKQFVDSRGCAFVRAGLGGEVTWVPRVTRDRELVCGLEPTFKAASDPAPVPEVKPADPVAVPVETADPGSVEPVSSAPVAVQPGKARPKSTSRAVAVAPAASPKPVAAPRKGQKVRVTCPARNGVGYSYIADAGDPVRCGITGISTDQASAVRKPVYRLPRAPSGYKYAFGEGRHNPNRGERTLEGTTAMNQVWTQEVPRRLIRATPAGTGATTDGAVAYRASTKATTKTGKRASGSTGTSDGHRYVQVGTFGVSRNASQAARQLRGLGLPVRTAKLERGGKTLHVILAGPFDTEAETRSALSTARGSGFSDAFPRR